MVQSLQTVPHSESKDRRAKTPDKGLAYACSGSFGLINFARSNECGKEENQLIIANVGPVARIPQGAERQIDLSIAPHGL